MLPLYEDELSVESMPRAAASLFSLSTRDPFSIALSDFVPVWIQEHWPTLPTSQTARHANQQPQPQL
ncbi:MAG: hypothetical protein GY820_06520 [Gammaproteobacteria bacterium]|nr:hypothetical protein [Gammaproteobacteria bacterium]